MQTDPTILSFIASVEARDAQPALSDAKAANLHRADRLAVITEDDDAIMAVGVAALHTHGDGTRHGAVETVVDPSMRFAEFERMVLDASLALVPEDMERSVWSARSSLDAALEAAGFHPARTLLYMTVALPLDPHRDEHATRAFEAADLDALIAVNNRAFADHREAGALTRDEFSLTMEGDGFDPSRIIVLEDDNELVGFCWTRIHGNGDGEIYRIAVDPAVHGKGYGNVLLRAGFAMLAAHPHVRRGTLWVDGSNEPAVRLYESIGMTVERRNREFKR